MSFTAELIISALLLLGGTFVLVGSIGLIRLQDLYVRLHAPTKATTLGLGGILIGSMLYMYFSQGNFGINELLISLFLVLTAPVTAHILAKAAMHNRVAAIERTRNLHLLENARMQEPPQPSGEKQEQDK
ncbi:Na+/H+ antiporter subunit G [Glaciecola punicea]|jgi:multicomponent K+:H+ antiporter subunit G|uniref:Na+/H+ antiporter subunit G n=1 Tax=Glaciecola punicea TaxID=56804 RepID=UPI000872D52A|nr:Na+/H+ antiporter subunit G [Glaciecola punicea]OFA32477.1 Na+/H+ antiporter subunit G [Glaciecola punicea]